MVRLARSTLMLAIVTGLLVLGGTSASAGAPILVSAARDVGRGYGAWSMHRDGSRVRDLAGDLPVGNPPAWDAARRGYFYTYFVKPPYEVQHVVGAEQTKITRNTISEFLVDAAPNGHRLAIAGERSSYGDIYTVSLPSGSSRRLTSSPRNDWSPDWSPDGTRLAWVRGDELWVMGGGGQAKHPVGDGIAAEDPAWSPDGRWIAFSDAGGNIARVRPDGRRLRIVIANDDVWGSTLMMPLWSPDGRRLAFTAARYHEVAEEWFNRIYVLGLDTGRLRNITPNLGSGQGAIAVDW